jgi:two-component system, cell cycle response regulator DivK
MHSQLPPVLAPRRAAPPPSRETSATPGTSRPPSVDRPLEGLRVLLVEDDPLSLKLLEVLLASEGCKVRSSRSAEEALDALPSFRPSVAVIDLILPLASGLLLAERLKADPATSDIVLVAVSAFNGPAADRSARAAGFSVYVRKPIDPDSFPDLLLNAVRGAR